ncbi:YkvA family protein [Aeromicrobium sp.]|uniref:YkvA family protein n=1 Tax=Aeromicrobium sp. TaxID=1871063 RepID=UPI0030C6079D
MLLDVLLSMAIAAAAVWVVLIGLLWHLSRAQGDPVVLREMLRLIPDVLLMLRRMWSDPGLPRSVRWRIGLLLVYLLSPIDLVPDFIPVLGYADDAIVVILILRSVSRRAGPGAMERHWPGSEKGLAALKRFAGLTV